MSLLDNAIKHFSESADAELHKIDVPEWDGSVWFKSVSSMNGLAYQKYYSAISQPGFESLVDILILRARTEEGLKMFRPSDKKTLMGQVAPDIITTIINNMSAVDNVEGEGVKKN